MTGRIQGISCTNLSQFSLTAGQCILRCYYLDQCRVAFVQCQDLGCTCTMCQGVLAIDFTQLDQKFYLKGRVLGENVTIPPYRRWDIPGWASHQSRRGSRIDHHKTDTRSSKQGHCVTSPNQDRFQLGCEKFKNRFQIQPARDRYTFFQLHCWATDRGGVRRGT